MLRDLLDITNDCVRFLVFEFLEEAEDEVEEEQAFNEKDFEVNNHLVFVRAESCLECLTECVLARREKHHEVKGRLPLAVLLDDQSIQYRKLLLLALQISLVSGLQLVEKLVFRIDDLLGAVLNQLRALIRLIDN